jgi:DNA-binding transcriptional LysR family regulator
MQPAAPLPTHKPHRRPRLRELEVLAAVVKEGKTTAAALRLGLSQPAVSRAIAALEASIGKPLFERDGGRLVANSEALRIVQETETVFDILDGLTGAPAPAPLAAPLKIAAPPTIAHRFMPRLVAGFLADHPDLSIHMEIGTTEAVVASVANANAHLGISDGLARHDGVTAYPYIRAIGHAVLPAGHGLANRRTVEPQDFTGETFIALTRRFHRRYVYDRIFAEHGAERRLVVETATSIAICEMVRAGLGISIVNPFPVALRDDDALVFRPFAPEVDYLSSFICPVGPVTPVAQRFIEFARGCIPEDDRFIAA